MGFVYSPCEQAPPTCAHPRGKRERGDWLLTAHTFSALSGWASSPATINMSPLSNRLAGISAARAGDGVGDVGWVESPRCCNGAGVNIGFTPPRATKSLDANSAEVPVAPLFRRSSSDGTGTSVKSSSSRGRVSLTCWIRGILPRVASSCCPGQLSFHSNVGDVLLLAGCPSTAPVAVAGGGSSLLAPGAQWGSEPCAGCCAGRCCSCSKSGLKAIVSS